MKTADSSVIHYLLDKLFIPTQSSHLVLMINWEHAAKQRTCWNNKQHIYLLTYYLRHCCSTSSQRNDKAYLGLAGLPSGEYAVT